MDSGADNTSLPLGFAALMGYDGATLRRQDGQGAGGTINTWVAQQSSQAEVPGWDGSGYEILPTFLEGGQMALWGRTDFFQRFDVAFHERRQAFVLSLV